ncbi:MAG: hypothetical protein DI534_14820, partial [Leifsonia xyli]
MAYNARAPQGGKKNPAGKATQKKVGGPSAKHRGYKPEADASRGGKKPRWSSEQRVAQGRGGERPRGQRSERAEDGRPNWEPRGKDARNAVERAPAARKRDSGYGDRSREERGFERRDDRGSDHRYADRPRTDRPRTDRPHGDRPHRLAGDRPQRHSYGDDRLRRDERFVREDDAPRREGYRGRDGVSSSR